MERYFILDNINTWYDLHLIITAKNIGEAEPKTNYVQLDGMSGTLDLSETLTGEITYNDRSITATFWTDYGTRKDREALYRKITSSLHGKKVKIIEPDDTDHYFYGRIKVKSKNNNLAYMTFDIEATCEPWRYAMSETVRHIDVNSPNETDLIINLDGVRTLSPIITVTGSVNIKFNDVSTPLIDGDYRLSNVKLRQGVNIIGVSGTGSVTLTYREADL